MIAASDSKTGVEKVDGILVYWCKNRYSNNMGFYRRLLSFFLFVYQCIAKSIFIKADIIYATSTPLTISIPAMILSSIKKIPFNFRLGSKYDPHSHDAIAT